MKTFKHSTYIRFSTPVQFNQQHLISTFSLSVLHDHDEFNLSSVGLIFINFDIESCHEKRWMRESCFCSKNIKRHTMKIQKKKCKRT